MNMNVNYRHTAQEIIKGAGTLMNIIMFERTDTGIRFTLSNPDAVDQRFFAAFENRDTSAVRGAVCDNGILDVTIEDSCRDEIYNEILRFSNYAGKHARNRSRTKAEAVRHPTQPAEEDVCSTETSDAMMPVHEAPEETQTAKYPLAVTDTGHVSVYTAGYFEEVAASAIMQDYELTDEQSAAVMRMIKKIAPDAARFANEKRLRGEFTFIPDIISAVIDADADEGQRAFTSNVFASSDGNAHITVSYQQKDGNEAYNLIVSSVETNSRVTYSGTANGDVENEGRIEEDTDPPKDESDTSGILYSIAAIAITALFIFIVLQTIFSSLREGISTAGTVQQQTETFQSQQQTETFQSQQQDESESQALDEAMTHLKNALSPLLFSIGIISLGISALRLALSLQTTDNTYDIKSASRPICMGIFFLLIAAIL